MSDELKRMQELAGVPVNEEKESLNEHYVAGGIVGVGAVNQIPPREKSDYEMAFEHFMTEGEEKEKDTLNELGPDEEPLTDYHLALMIDAGMIKFPDGTKPKDVNDFKARRRELEEAGFEPNIGDGDEGFGDMNYRMEEGEEVEEAELKSSTLTRTNAEVKNVPTMAKAMLDFFNQVKEKEKINFETNADFNVALKRLTTLAA